ncbi:uncharacterized protein LOC114363959 [Ostrinia furnacalis]|uniref:uncharacterized protein LOC114363959 n=1 Tax=Ostrinia furnacalis TaxID=93504 RepID=UPI00103AA445|nr:uncharacterized protein LOC114363959 [Ostrinia furnacalis]
MASDKTLYNTRAGPSDAGESRGRSPSGRSYVYGGTITASRLRPRNNDLGERLTDSDLLDDLDGGVNDGKGGGAAGIAREKSADAVAENAELLTCSGEAQSVGMEDSDTEGNATDMSFDSVASRTSRSVSRAGTRTGSRTSERLHAVKRARARNGDSDEALGSASSGSPARDLKAPSVKRGRGRSVTTGVRAERALKKQTEAQERKTLAGLEADEHAEIWTKKLLQMRARVEYAARERTTAELLEYIRSSTDAVVAAYKKCPNISETVQRAFKESSVNIAGAISVLLDRSPSEEVQRLTAANKKLERELGDLKKEFQALKEFNSKVTPPSVPPPAQSQQPDPEEYARNVMIQVGNMVNARIEALEPRLLPEERLRPPLAADRRRRSAEIEVEFPPLPPSKSVATSKPAAPGPSEKPEKPAKQHTADRSQTAPTPAAKKEANPVSTTRRNKKKKGARRAPTPGPLPAREPRSLPPPPATMEEGWSTVVRRGGGKTRKQANRENNATQLTGFKAASKASPDLHPPRSAAIVLTLQPGAKERGVKYEDLIREAKSRINIEELGIVTGLRFRKAKTGGKLLEIPGATSGDRADALATKLREVLPEEDVRVSRPVKTVEVRITGLDDSVTGEELAVAVAKAGNCAIEGVRVGPIRESFLGSGSATVRVPVEVAKQLAKGRLLVGWVSAQVRVLTSKPQRCYRCLVEGHVAAQCPSEVDRSELCFRCGQPGHKSRDCTAPPHCPLCASAGRPAEHRVGNKSCNPPKVQGRTGRQGADGTPTATPKPQQRGRTEVMDTTTG